MGRNSPPHVDFVLGSDDVSRVRFGISPGSELASGLCALQAPESAPLHWGWLRAQAPRVPEWAWQVMTAVVPATGYYPDFVTTDPSWDLTPEDEVRAVRETDAAQVVRDLTKVAVRATGSRRALVEQMVGAPEAARDRIADAWSAVWEAVMEPHWPQLRQMLEADLALRARQLAEGGLEEMVGRLHERVSWHDDRIRVRMRVWSEEVRCEGSGLLLVPTVLGAPWCSVVTEAPAVPMLVYPAAGVSPTWPTTADDRADAVTHLLGAGRAGVLLTLDVPCSTSEVARRCDLAVSTASHHLSVLREARLVSSQRTGATVVHSRTPLGDQLVAP